MNDEKRYLHLLGKVLSQEASTEEEQQLEAWAQEDNSQEKFVQETKLIWEKAVHYDRPIASNKEAAWARLESRVETSVPTQQPRIKALWYKVAAAVLVVAMGLGWAYQQQGPASSLNVQPVLASITTGAAEQKEVQLPDGSTILLNEKSTITYDRAFKKRLINLEGEAFFEVTKRAGQPFEILAADTRTTVLGTSFNIRAYTNQPTEIAVVTGKVAFEAVDASKKEHILLQPNEMASYQGEQGMTKKTWEDKNVLAWKTKQLEFDNQMLSVVLPILERHYKVKIEGSAGLLNCHYTGNFSQVKLEEVLKTIAFTFPTAVNIEEIDGSYVLTGQGCD